MIGHAPASSMLQCPDEVSRRAPRAARHTRRTHAESPASILATVLERPTRHRSAAAPLVVRAALVRIASSPCPIGSEVSAHLGRADRLTPPAPYQAANRGAATTAARSARAVWHAGGQPAAGRRGSPVDRRRRRSLDRSAHVSAVFRDDDGLGNRRALSGADEGTPRAGLPNRPAVLLPPGLSRRRHHHHS